MIFCIGIVEFGYFFGLRIVFRVKLRENIKYFLGIWFFYKNEKKNWNKLMLNYFFLYFILRNKIYNKVFFVLYKL